MFSACCFWVFYERLVDWLLCCWFGWVFGTSGVLRGAFRLICNSVVIVVLACVLFNVRYCVWVGLLYFVGLIVWWLVGWLVLCCFVSSVVCLVVQVGLFVLLVLRCLCCLLLFDLVQHFLLLLVLFICVLLFVWSIRVGWVVFTCGFDIKWFELCFCVINICYVCFCLILC